MKAFWSAMGCVAWMSPAEDKPGASALLVPQGAERVSPPPAHLYLFVQWCKSLLIKQFTMVFGAEPVDI